MQSLKHVFNEFVNGKPKSSRVQDGFELLSASGCVIAAITADIIQEAFQRIRRSHLITDLILPETVMVDDDIAPEEFQPVYGPPTPTDLAPDNSYGFTKAAADALIAEHFNEIAGG